jgi:CheY-like chemotaxis protein
MSVVLVVGQSNINRVVVCKIVERCGLRPLSEPPHIAARMLQTLRPGTVILDGGPDNRDCEVLIERLGALRQSSNPESPSVILLTTRNLDPADQTYVGVVDAVVSKPILPELLQPVVNRLVERARG